MRGARRICLHSDGLAFQTVRQAIARFTRREDGTLVYFSLMLFVMMMMMGGFAVDLMRYETIRTSLQNTLDRSTLAAASLTQRLNSTTVVNDYFAKAGLSAYLTAITVREGFNFREVAATAVADTNPIFMHMIGINSFDASGRSVAEQRITNVEIALVLDISGSMIGTKLTNLKSAANEFVNTVLSSDGDDRISIALVPYNGQVNLGALLRAKYNATDDPGVANVNCIDLPSSVYSSTDMSRTLAMPMTAHADTYSSTSQSTSYISATDSSSATPTATNRWCPPSSVNIVRLPSANIATLQSQINAMTAVGATSINAGMKWGLALLDPSARTMYSQFISANQIPAIYEGRPYDYTDPEAMKVIVLMTDGEHFAEERVNTAYKSGVSPIWRSSGDSNYSIRFTSGRPSTAGTNEYWVPHLGTWRSTPWTNNSTAAVAQTWPQVWSGMRLSYVAWQFYARALGTTSSTRTSTYNSQMLLFRTQTSTGNMDTQLRTMCGFARTNGVTVYGIAVEAPAAGQTLISGCATSTAHYFNATSAQVRTAFRAIANNISQLRLTQ